MNTLTKENKIEERMVKNSTTSSQRLLRSAKESVIGNRLKRSSIDDGVFQFADRLWNPWSGFTKKPLLNRRQNNIANNKVSLLRIESFVDRTNKPLNETAKKIEKVMVPIENLKLSNITNNFTKDEAEKKETDLKNTIEWDWNSYAENYYNKMDGSSAQINKIGWKANIIMSGINNKGSISGRRPRPNTANFFKIKQPPTMNRNRHIAENRNNQFQSNTTKNMSRITTDIQTPQEHQKPVGWSFGTDGFLKRKFTIKDLVE